ncbi:Chitin synthase, class 1 [Entomortierella beljakovae]|nr:Chitin synthase, class 1 [Entomortierella beljakovae]
MMSTNKSKNQKPTHNRTKSNSKPKNEKPGVNTTRAPIPNNSSSSSSWGQTGGANDGSLQMLPIQNTPTPQRFPGGGMSAPGSNLNMTASSPSGAMWSSQRPLPNPADEAHLIRQRSQAQMYPSQNVPFSTPMSMPTPQPMTQIPDGSYPFAPGYGSQTTMASGSPYQFQMPHPQQNPTTLHYGPLPRRQTRRYKTTKKVTLTEGNLVLDCPIPSKLMDISPRKNGDEFTNMRYTAVTCDPNEFKQQNYTLRPKMLNRETELFIVMTMYNVSPAPSLRKKNYKYN